MHLKTLLGMQAIALPVGFSLLTVGKVLLLALLIALSFGVFVWMKQAARDHTRVQASRRIAARKLSRAIEQHK